MPGKSSALNSMRTKLKCMCTRRYIAAPRFDVRPPPFYVAVDQHDAAYDALRAEQPIPIP
jgi:hypothetical protein